jgi:2-amino-4-hydroxy-6-hydroxymethyldihydropteridine diphosphokinase
VNPKALGKVPAGPVRVVLALGANLGDRRATLQSAVEAIDAFEGVRAVAVSPLMETAPVGGPEQPNYLNAVVVVETSLSPLELLAACQQVENEHGRQRAVRWGPRTLDVDIVTYPGVVASTSQLALPHPRAAERAFVLVPWLALDPAAELPGPDGVRVPVADLIARLDDVAGVRPSTAEALEVPR